MFSTSFPQKVAKFLRGFSSAACASLALRSEVPFFAMLSASPNQVLAHAPRIVRAANARFFFCNGKRLRRT
jgi:hypothetical protein